MSLPKNINDCHKLIQQLIDQNEKLIEQNNQLMARVKELEARLNQNSNNSSKPPSTDIVKSRRLAALKSKGKKPSGGQEGHKGNTLRMVPTGEVTKVEQVKPDRCRCGKRLLRQPMEVQASRQVFDIPDPKLEVTEYQQMVCTCPDCGAKNKGEFPDQVNAPVQYGNGVRALIALLSVKCQLSEKNISELFEDLFGYAVNSGTIQSVLNRAHEKMTDVADQIKTQALQSDCLHLDETGFQIAKKRNWLHVMSNADWTFLYPDPSRGKQAIKDNVPELYDYTGSVVHDCWASYWSLFLAAHVLCNCHLLRELQALIDQGSKWAPRMHSLLMRLYQKYLNGEQIDRSSSSWRTYKGICEAALEEEPEPIKGPRGKPKKSKGLNLAERFIKHQEAVLRFAIEPDIPFTNNQAERDVRPTKGKLKIAGCFRTWKGARRYARLQSVFSTWRKQKYDIFKELKNILNGNEFTFA